VSLKAIAQKYQASSDEVFRQRCVFLKEQRAELVKHHLWVLRTDYFKPVHSGDLPVSWLRAGECHQGLTAAVDAS